MIIRPRISYYNLLYITIFIYTLLSAGCVSSVAEKQNTCEKLIEKDTIGSYIAYLRNHSDIKCNEKGLNLREHERSLLLAKECSLFNQITPRGLDNYIKTHPDSNCLKKIKDIKEIFDCRHIRENNETDLEVRMSECDDYLNTYDKNSKCYKEIKELREDIFCRYLGENPKKQAQEGISKCEDYIKTYGESGKCYKKINNLKAEFIRINKEALQNRQDLDLYQKAMRENTLEAYDDYRRHGRDQKRKAVINRKRDLLLFRNAERGKTISHFNYYFDNCDPCHPDQMRIIGELRDKINYDAAKRESTIDAYDTYLANCGICERPNCETCYKREEIIELRDNEYYENAMNSRYMSSYLSYLLKCTFCELQDDIKYLLYQKVLRNLKTNIDDPIDFIKQYIEKYPPPDPYTKLFLFELANVTKSFDDWEKLIKGYPDIENDLDEKFRKKVQKLKMEIHPKKEPSNGTCEPKLYKWENFRKTNSNFNEDNFYIDIMKMKSQNLVDTAKNNSGSINLQKRLVYIEKCIHEESKTINKKWRQDYFQLVSKINRAKRYEVTSERLKNNVGQILNDLEIQRRMLQSLKYQFQQEISEVPKAYIVIGDKAQGINVSPLALGEELRLGSRRFLQEQYGDHFIKSTTEIMNHLLISDIIEYFKAGRVQSFEFDPVEKLLNSHMHQIQAYRLYPLFNSVDRTGDNDDGTNSSTEHAGDFHVYDTQKSLYEQDFPSFIVTNNLEPLKKMIQEVKRTNSESLELIEEINGRYEEAKNKETGKDFIGELEIIKNNIQLEDVKDKDGSKDPFDGKFKNHLTEIKEGLEQLITIFQHDKVNANVVKSLKESFHRNVNSIKKEAVELRNHDLRELETHINSRDVIVVTSISYPYGERNNRTPMEFIDYMIENSFKELRGRANELLSYKFFRVVNLKLEEAVAREVYKDVEPIQFTLPISYEEQNDDSSKYRIVMGLRFKLRIPESMNSSIPPVE